MNSHVRTATLLACMATGAAVLIAGMPADAHEPVSAEAETSATETETETMVLAMPFEGGHGRFIDTGGRASAPETSSWSWVCRSWTTPPVSSWAPVTLSR